MARYENTKIKDISKRRGLSQDKVYNISCNNTTFYSSVPESDDDIYVITQPGDRLDQLAHQFYGDVTLWWYIAKANGYATMNVPADKQIRIPVDLAYAKVELK